jgi:hypothetical protein
MFIKYLPITKCEYDNNIMEMNKYKVIKGKDFKNLFPNYKAVSSLTKDLTYNDKNKNKYKIGINKDKTLFMAQTNLYFYDNTDLKIYLHDQPFIAKVEILDDSEIYINNDKCKTDKFKIVKIQDLYKYIETMDNVNEQFDLIIFIIKNIDHYYYSKYFCELLTKINITENMMEKIIDNIHNVILYHPKQKLVDILIEHHKNVLILTLKKDTKFVNYFTFINKKIINDEEYIFVDKIREYLLSSRTKPRNDEMFEGQIMD